MISRFSKDPRHWKSLFLGAQTVWLSWLPLDHAHAEDMQALLRDRGCYACHTLTESTIGPSYQAIARLHQDRKNIMVEVLAHKIIAGGAGNWGLVPMVPSEHVSEEEARRMAEWILNLQAAK